MYSIRDIHNVFSPYIDLYRRCLMRIVCSESKESKVEELGTSEYQTNRISFVDDYVLYIETAERK